MTKACKRDLTHLNSRKNLEAWSLNLDFIKAMAFSRSKTISLVRSRFNQWKVSTPFEPAIYEQQQRSSFGGWFGSTWSLSAGRGSLKSCYGVKLCLMLVENAVLCQRNYDGFLCYFFYLIITISFQINIQSFVDFQRRILRVSVCFTSFLGLWWSVSKARSIFILKWEGYSHSPVFFPGEYTYLSAWVFRSMIFPYF